MALGEHKTWPWGSTRPGLGGAQDLALGEHKTGLGELHGSLSLVWGSLSLVWANTFLTCFSLSENSSKTHFCPKINETQFCREFVLSFLFWTDFTDNSIVLSFVKLFGNVYMIPR